ncbi:MAG TPA: aldo/keto reductase [Longimicrobiales bacterium]
MIYRRCGRSGLVLPAISLGLWHNFGAEASWENARAIAVRAFDLGITHFDLANNYGPPPGSAEETFGRLMRGDFVVHRDELIVSTKAGYRMWEGHYGDGGSRKYLVASLDQSLRRLGLDYVDVFYHHRPDPHTPLEETMLALDHVVRQGKTLYVGISNYDADRTRAAAGILRELRTPFVIHQPKYSMLHRAPEDRLFDVLRAEGIGCMAFSPLAQGLLSERYLEGVPPDSRAAGEGFLTSAAVTPRLVTQLRELARIAAARGQSIAQLALSWVLRDEVVTSALIGVSRVEQLEQNVAALDATPLTTAELAWIDDVLAAA